jgi:hypothetical protein
MMVRLKPWSQKCSIRLPHYPRWWLSFRHWYGVDSGQVDNAQLTGCLGFWNSVKRRYINRMWDNIVSIAGYHRGEVWKASLPFSVPYCNQNHLTTPVSEWRGEINQVGNCFHKTLSDFTWRLKKLKLSHLNVDLRNVFGFFILSRFLCDYRRGLIWWSNSLDS